MNYTWSRVSAPRVNVLSLDDAKIQIRQGDITVEDDAIERRLRSATRQTEEYLRRGLLTQTWRYAQDDFTNEIWLPRAAPLQSITSFQYYDAAGTLQTVGASLYLTDTDSEPARLCLAPNQVWPAVQADRPLAVIVTYVVGWVAPDDVPADIVDAICLRLGSRHAFREGMAAGGVANLPDGIEALLASHRVFCPPPCEAA